MFAKRTTGRHEEEKPKTWWRVRRGGGRVLWKVKSIEGDLLTNNMGCSLGSEVIDGFVGERRTFDLKDLIE